MRLDLMNSMQRVVGAAVVDILNTIGTYMSSKINAICLDQNSWAPVSLKGDCYLKPCNLYATFEASQAMFDWCKQQGADPESDLDIRVNDIENIYKSKSWMLVQDGITNGNPCPVCVKQCGAKK